MKIKTAYIYLFRNAERFQFIAEVIDAITKFSPEALKIVEQTDILLSRYREEDKALRKINKSATTAKIMNANHARNNTFRGMADVCKSALRHYSPETVEAAKRLNIVFHAYGNIARKGLIEGTAAIYNMCQELKSSKYSADAEIAGLTGWIEKLDADNNALEELCILRNSENAAKTKLNLRKCRAETDKAYGKIVEHINAAVVIEGKAGYEKFVNVINAIIDRYSIALARRAGRGKA